MKKISILIAVRNEERIILSCLENLKTAINEFYKTEKNKANFELEILLGDDNSDDKSAKIINQFIKENQKLNFYYFKISKNNNEFNQNNLKGKANVIHQLINYSEGESIILLDADILVNPNWLKELLKTYYQNDKIKMVMGTTIPKLISKPNTATFFNNFQTIDWIFGQGILAIFSKLGFPQTAMGNNLIFDKSIYQEIGGYNKIEFSVTEDVALFKAFQNYINGRWWRHQQRQDNYVKSHRCSCPHERQTNNFFIQLFNADSLAFTEAEPTLKDWILQRHRWFCGAWQFSNFIKKGLLLIYLFRIIFVLGILLGIILSGNFNLMTLFLTILGINFLLTSSFFRQLKLKINLSIFVQILPLSPPTTILQIIIFCLLEPFLYFLVGLHFLKTKKVKWKGREF